MEKIFDILAEKQTKFIKDTLVGHVDENNAVVSSDVFDPEGMQTHVQDPELGKIFEKNGY